MSVYKLVYYEEKTPNEKVKQKEWPLEKEKYKNENLNIQKIYNRKRRDVY